MNNTDPTLPMAHPPISSSSDMRPRDTLLQRGAFDPPATPGTLGRLDRFEILRLIGEGGMGQVYLAREPLTDSQVAIKIMKPDAADDPREVHRFLTEARHMYRLSHPRILRVLEVSDRPAGPYYVMPFIAGGSLLARCKPGETLPEAEVLSIARQVAEALAHAHAHGLIHRDLKPGNVLLDKEGNAYLTDFGLVRTFFNDSMVDATASHLEGTAPYMSPAVARGEAEDTRCDIYAFGALLYELLTGKPPYTGRTPQIILDQVLKGPPAPLREVNPKASPALVKIAEGCMARELRDRYASMGDVVVDLARAAGSLAPLGQHQRGRSLPHRLATLAAAALAIAVLAGVAVWRFGIRSPATPSAVSGVISPSSNVTLSTPGVLVPVVQSLASGVLGATTEVDQPSFIYTTNNSAITVTEYTGPGGDVVVPDSIGGLPVTGIGRRLFSNMKMQSVRIPLSITLLEPPASSHSHSAVGAFHIDPDNPVFKSNEDGVWFSKNGDTLIAYPPGRSGEYEIPQHVTTIGGNAFQDAMISRLVIPGSVRRIESSAFLYCQFLTEVDIPASVELIQDNPFSDCIKLDSIMVDERNPFYFCKEGVLFNQTGTALIAYPPGKTGSYAIPERVQEIKRGAFRGCVALTNLTVPASVRRLADFVFNGCKNCAAIFFEGDIPLIGQGNIFDQSTWPTVYYRPGTKGWGKTFGERPTAVWEVAPAVGTSGPTASSLQPSAAIPETSIYDFACTAADGAVTIGKYTGEGGAVVIPETISGLPVVAIQNEAFKNFTNVTAVVIPNSATNIGAGSFINCSNLARISFGAGVANIGDWAFANCTSLTRVVIGTNVTRIGNSAFQGCRRLTAVTIPATVTSLTADAFLDCGNLVSILVDVLNPIYSSSADGVLFNKDKTRLVCYPAGKAGKYMIPGNVTVIGGWAFRDCASLTSVMIPNGVAMIEGGAFCGCAGLTSITIPASVTGLEAWALAGCSSLTSIQVAGANPSFSSDAEGVVFSKDRSVLACYPGGKPGNYVIPDHVTRIGVGAFEGRTGLTSVTIPNVVTTIERSAFKNCTNLLGVAIPDSVTSIGDEALHGCTSLASIKIPDSVTSIGVSAFYGCTNLGAINIGSGVTNIAASAFGGCVTLVSITIPDGVVSVGQGAFRGCRALASAMLPTGTTVIEDQVFDGCASLVDIEIPVGVTSIGDCAFRGCTSLPRVTIPDGVTTIKGHWGGGTFNGCATLVSVTIPDTVTTIGVAAFTGCTNLAMVVVGHSVTNIANWAFSYSSRLTRVYFKGNPPCAASDTSVFFGATQLTIYYRPGTPGWGKDLCGYPTAEWDGVVPTAAEPAPLVHGPFSYRVKNGAVTIAKYTGPGGAVTIPKAFNRLPVAVIGDSAFIHRGDVTDISIPNGISSIESSAFRNCSNLTSITIPASVKTLGSWLFEGCSRLNAIMVDPANTTYSSSDDGVVFDRRKTTLVRYPNGKAGHYVIPDGVSTIGDRAFESSKELTDVTFSANVIRIDGFAFNGCSKLTGATIPDGVPSIAVWAFRDCTSLTNITIPNSVTSIGEGALANCTQLTGITIPKSVVDIGGAAFWNCQSLTNVTMSKGVIHIWDGAFSDCARLKSMTMPESVAEIRSNAFFNSTNLTSVYFGGNAPSGADDGTIFARNAKATVYYRSGTKGWGETFGGRPTAVWKEER